MKPEIPMWAKNGLRQLRRFQYPLLILLVGIGLMLLPAGTKKQEEVNTTPQAAVSDKLEERLETVLKEVDGAGAVRVLLTLESGAVSFYQENVQTSGAENGETRTETVLLSDNGAETPILVKTIYPTYQGAVVVCEGADKATVRLNIIRAVSSLTGLSSDKITVIKMKHK